jgi:hypothetical protein
MTKHGPFVSGVKDLIKVFKSRLTRRVFTRIYTKRRWISGGTLSGSGSMLPETEVIRAELPHLLRDLEARALLDIPCGDFNWMQELDLQADYAGADIVAPLIKENQRRFGSGRRRFFVADVIKDQLPAVDLILCRDCLVHLSNEDAVKAVSNIKRSGARYLLVTTYPTRTDNPAILTGAWRAVNLELPPFGFPPPLRLINENSKVDGGKWNDKSLGLWRVADLP